MKNMLLFACFSPTTFGCDMIEAVTMREEGGFLNAQLAFAKIYHHGR